MSAVAIDQGRIESDIKRLMSDSSCKMKTLKRNIDFKGIAGDFFQTKDYSYTLNNNGDFSIIAAPGMSIIGQWQNVHWSVKVNVIFDTNSAESKESILMSPASFEEYELIFDSVISELQNLYDTYTKTTKANKSSKLLSQLVSQYARKIKLTELNLAPNDDDHGLLKLERRIAGNLYISTVLDFENYESRCIEVLEALNILPPFANEPFMKFIFYKKKTDTDWLGYSNNKLQSTIQFETGEKPEMKYDKNIEGQRSSLMKSENIENVDKEIIDILSDSNFIYSFNNNILQIFFAEKWGDVLALSYKDSKIWLSHRDKFNYKILTKEYEITTEELKELLKSIAEVSMKEGDFKIEAHIDFYYPRNNYLYEILGEIYKYRLPANYYKLWTPWIEVFNDEKGDEGFRWSGNRSNWWAISLKVFEDYETIRSLPHLWDKEIFPNIKVIIK